MLEPVPRKTKRLDAGALVSFELLVVVWATRSLSQDDAAGVLMEANHDAVVATAMLDAAREYRERGGSLMVCVFVVHSCSSTTKVRPALLLLT